VRANGKALARAAVSAGVANTIICIHRLLSNRKTVKFTNHLQLIPTLPTALAGFCQAAAAKLAREGSADDALVLLLEANLQEAQKAGEAGIGATRVLTNIK
jgi:hypothetical protein